MAGRERLHSRLNSRYKASCRGRWGVDCIPWLYDLLENGRGAEVELIAHAYATRDEALVNEKHIRQMRRDQGWGEVTGLI